MNESEALEWLDRRGIRTLRVVWSDMHGHLRGKPLPREVFETNLTRRVAFCDGALAWDVTAAVYDDIEFSNFDTGYPDMLARPDLDTLRPLGWLDDHAMVFGVLEDHHGHTIELSPRYLLRDRSDALRKQTPVSIQVSMNFHVVPRANPAPNMETVRGRPDTLLNGMYEALSLSEIDLERLDLNGHQFRLVLSPSEPVEAADQAVIAKNAIKEFLVPRGWVGSFMARPQNGPINHCELAVACPDGSDPSEWEAALRRSLPGMLPLLCPTINSYKRLRFIREQGDGFVRRGFLEDGREGVVQSFTGSDSNPYLSVTAVLAALLEMDTDRAENPRVAETLDRALESFRTSPIARRQLGENFVEHHASILDHEVEQFRRSVTSWEQERYREIV